MHPNRGHFSFQVRRNHVVQQQLNAKDQSRSFSLNAVPPPSSLSGRPVNAPLPKPCNYSSGISKHGYHTMESLHQHSNASQYSIVKRRGRTEDEYFDEDDEPATQQLEYIPAPGSPTAADVSSRIFPRSKPYEIPKNISDEEDEEDPLDAFMAGIEAQVKMEKNKIPQPHLEPKKGTRGDIDDEDDEESYYRYMQENPHAGLIDEGSDAEMDYDEDGNPVPPQRRRDIDPLPSIDHTEIDYLKFEKNFYIPHEDIVNLSQAKVQDLRLTLGVKWNWLLTNLVKMLSEGSVLIFVTKKADAEETANNLRLKDNDVVLLHGDMDQSERNFVITRFKRKDVDIMVATDVAARGLDIPHIRTVVNYDTARDIDTHTHRIGRTGRAGEKGTAYTLITDKDKEFSGHLVRNLEGANQDVPEDLMKLAMQSSWFRNSRFKHANKGKNLNVGGAGLGFRQRAIQRGPMGRSLDASKVLVEDGDPSGPSPGSSKGPATDRLSAMRETYRAHYNAQFKASSDRTWENTVPEGGVFIKPAQPGLESSSKSDSNHTSKHDTMPRKKKSRWN
uniref:Uncharacterized protein n=1 Tax=Anopheles arabiensis TaxID=7173 RepID=A0A182HML2_ANOAR